ncbi:MAG: hypothetical protein U9N02_06095 [Campylobacterota bacterium]|nr:hypothetical protein [Campylobacterota bacterium]
MSDNQDKYDILINISEANKAQKYEKRKELFQIDAFDKIAEILKEHQHGEDTKNITDCRFHSTIFIDGDRGVGKTAFMLNIERFYSDEIKNDDKKKKYAFLNPVDPTLLENSEKFLSVVLGAVVDKVNQQSKQCEANELDEKYYKALEQLSKSLEAIGTMKDNIGIEEIAAYKSSSKLEQNAHNFFKIVSEILCVKSLVILIDDVDMAFDKGFDVLEVVRKYLASPFIIPIVAGDMKLYKEIVETEFMEKIRFHKDVQNLKSIYGGKEILSNSDEYKNKASLVNNLVEQYLHKIFPNEYHIQLKDIFQILKEKTVLIKFADDVLILYKDVKDFEIRLINYGINQKEFTHQVFTNNTRDFVQYLYNKKEIFEYAFKNKKNLKEKLAQDIKVIKEEISELEKLQETELQIEDLRNKILEKENITDILIEEYFLNNPKKHQETLKLTADFYRYSNNEDKKRLSLLLDNDVNAFTDNGYSIYEALKGEFFLKQKKPFNKIDKEVIVNSAYLPKDRYENWENKEDKKYSFLYLMLHNNFYSSVGTRELFITGKFLEAMICLLDNTMDIDKKRDKLKQLNFNIPILSNISKNKYIDNLKDDDKINEENISLNKDFSQILDNFENNSSFFTSTFLYEMLKKYINNINILKAGEYNKDIFESFSVCESTNKAKEIFENNPIYDSVKRVMYIFINSIASFESKKNVYSSNIAISNGDIENIKNSKTYKNIEEMENNSLTKIFISYFEDILEYRDDDEQSIFNLTVKERKFDLDKELKNLGYKYRATPKDKLETMKKMISKIENNKYTKSNLEIIFYDSSFNRTILNFGNNNNNKNFTDIKEIYNEIAGRLSLLLSDKIS